MQNEKMREEFEAWMRDKAKIVVGSTDPYPAGLERDYWKVWKASRESLVIELPSEDDTRCDTVAEIAKQEAYNLALGECASAIEAAGLKVKP